MDSQTTRPSDDATRIWRRYKATGDRALRDRLVLTYAPLVRHIVYRKLRELPSSCEVDDLISSGIEGLIGALDRYDPSKGAPLEQFVWTRIHGAVLDDLRKLDWAPRSLRRWERDVNEGRDLFTGAHGRQPTTVELADSMGVPVSELRGRLDDIARSEMTSLNSLTLSDEDGAIERIHTIRSTDERLDPEIEVGRTVAKERFRRAFSHLPERERQVAVLLYVKNLTLREIGDVLGVSESRVCQIHGELKRKLLASLDRDVQLFSDVA